MLTLWRRVTTSMQTFVRYLSNISSRFFSNLEVKALDLLEKKYVTYTICDRLVVHTT